MNKSTCQISWDKYMLNINKSWINQSNFHLKIGGNLSCSTEKGSTVEIDIVGYVFFRPATITGDHNLTQKYKIKNVVLA